MRGTEYGLLVFMAVRIIGIGELVEKWMLAGICSLPRLDAMICVGWVVLRLLLLFRLLVELTS